MQEQLRQTLPCHYPVLILPFSFPGVGVEFPDRD